MKRLFDVLVAFTGLILLAPLLLVLAGLVRLKHGSPILFRQRRPGKNAQPFVMFKFRTMSSSTDRQGKLLPDKDRLTQFGKLLRQLSLDELPELWNVLKGDMSLVGPRPLLMEYLPYYSKEQARRHNVRPGITGWAQVNGRNALTWDEKFTLDVWYVDNQSFWLDLEILARTVVAVLKREGINADGQATMSPFQKNRASEKNDQK